MDWLCPPVRPSVRPSKFWLTFAFKFLNLFCNPPILSSAVSCYTSWSKTVLETVDCCVSDTKLRQFNLNESLTTLQTQHFDNIIWNSPLLYFSHDIVTILLCASELLLPACSSVSMYLDVGSSQLPHHNIQNFCSSLLSAMAVVSSPLETLFRYYLFFTAYTVCIKIFTLFYFCLFTLNFKTWWIKVFTKNFF